MRQKKLNDSIAQVKLQILNMTAELNLLREGSKSEEPHRQQNFFTNLYSRIRRWARDRRIASLNNKIKYTENNVQSVAAGNISSELRRLDEINNTILNEKYLMYGAIGETNVVNELKKLPKTYHVINDFNVAFSRPIYNRAENDRICSIQVDHLIVGPSGIFIVETKYWSDESISNKMLFSPVKQVKRAGFALFVLLNDAVKSRHIMKLVNHWGERKISPKQIVASVNSTPHAEFQYVKVLGIEKLNSYITYGKQEFTTEEVQHIVGYLMHAR